MPYIGNTPADKFLTLAKQNFSTSATTSYTLDSAVSSTQDIALFINSVRQSPVDAYSVSGTALTLTSATAGTDEMYCVYLGKTVGTVSPASDSVTTAMIQSNAVTNAKMSDDAIGVAELSATGTASSSTFLRGDNAWATAGGTNTPSFFARNTSNQDITHGVDTKVIVDSEFFDTDGCFNNTGSTATLNGISVPSYSFAPNVAGKYFFSFTGSFSDDSATSSNLAYFVMRISVNNVWKTRNVFNLNNNQGRQGTGTLTLLTDLDGVDDYVHFMGEVGTTDSSTARIMGDYVRVNGFKLL